MKHPNDMVQMDILGPFYIHQSSARNYIISCIDDCSRKVTSKYSERKRSIDVLDVLEEWIMVNGKPKKIMHDNGKQFTSKIFKRFLEHNNIKDKPDYTIAKNKGEDDRLVYYAKVIQKLRKELDLPPAIFPHLDKDITKEKKGKI